jgi:5,5'-dehydrodivanillate O-demethylase
MITAEENDLLTRVGPGTPMGNLQRRYWHVVGALEEMENRWTKRVRLLGEDLVLYRDRTGTFGLIAEFCPHRRASLAYGIPTEDGIRCPYHGWKFDGTGRCLEQPNEPEGSAFKDKDSATEPLDSATEPLDSATEPLDSATEPLDSATEPLVTTAGYPVETLGGMIFAYLGPLPAPLLPRWDGFVGDRVIRMCGWSAVSCNWLQAMENSLDPVHTEWLHGKLQEFVEEKQGNTYTNSRKHLKIDFAEFEYGVYKRRLLAGSSEESDDWKVGHPVLFPNILAVGSGGGTVWKFHAYQLRVPVDDEHMMHYWYNVYEPPAATDVPRHLLERVPFYEMPLRDESGEYMLDLIDVQDVMAWETQGPIAKRDLEKLGTTDTGVILFRTMLKRELAKVERGEDPMGVIRDPAKNDVIRFPLERDKVHFLDGFATQVRRSVLRFSPFAQDLCDVFSAYNADKLRQVLPPLPVENVFS